MRFSEVLIIPAGDHASPIGRMRPPRRVDNLLEVEIIDRYVRAIVDELDDAGVRHRVLPVRRPPGVEPSARHLGIFPGTLVLHCSLGWDDKKRGASNKSAAFIGTDEASTLAVLVAETMAHWGQTYVAYEHRGCNPVVDGEDRLLAVEGASGLRLEPFMLNGPSAGLYAEKLEELGRDIGRVVSDFIIAQQEAARNRPSHIAAFPLK